ncbi:hypothetical protein [Crenalkalicoccus roseus]|uniref:hypothetical protein n=1 Tax=Crenalkalicoccus roseus TaxID=1485588 RepID=UPI0010815D56|nr:hypothetical protein [Crenalkalicoccus roseus]
MRQSDHPKYPLPDEPGPRAVYAGRGLRAVVLRQEDGRYRIRGGSWLDGAECVTAAAAAFWLKKLGLGFAGWERA